MLPSLFWSPLLALGAPRQKRPLDWFSSTESVSSGRPIELEGVLQSHVPVGLGYGYYRFTFGKESGSWAHQSFSIRLEQEAIVNVFDCFCYGDTFILFDNDRYPPNEVVTLDCDGGANECLEYWDTPLDCINQEGNCRITTTLPRGCHNLTIWVRESNYHGGDGFLGVFPTTCTAETCSQEEFIYN